jgi:heat-inducible transcriptional repressor
VTAKDRHELSDRSLRVLATLVREHIETGEPVASGILARRGGFGLSSATIRSIVAGLEEQGYVWQPHTSAGRVPTDLGYRCFVDQILQIKRPVRSAAVEAQLRQQVGSASDLDSVLSTVSHVLSTASHHVAFALAPAGQDTAFHHVEFLQLGQGRVLVIVVARRGQVSHKIVDLDEELTNDDLQEAATYLNTEFAGMSLAEVRAAIVQNLKQERVRYDRLMARALRLARSSFENMSEPDSVYVEGASALFEEAAEPNSGITLGALSSLVKMIEDKHRLVCLLTAYMEAPGLTVIIGDEHAEPGLRPFSLVASTYSGGEGTGTVGVIGPMRMHYSRAITMVNGIAEAVSRVLADAKWDDPPSTGS